MGGQGEDLLTLRRTLLGLTGEEAAKPGLCGAGVARRHCKDTKHSSSPSWTGRASCFSLFPKPLRPWLASSFLGNTDGQHRKCGPDLSLPYARLATSSCPRAMKYSLSLSLSLSLSFSLSQTHPPTKYILHTFKFFMFPASPSP